MINFLHFINLIMASAFGLGAGGTTDQPKGYYDKMVYDTLNYRKK